MMAMNFIVVVMLCSLPFSLCIESNIPHITSWPRSGMHHSHQSTHSLLMSLNQGLDSMRYTASISLDNMNRKIEALESRLALGQTKMQLKLETLSQTVTSCEVKDELSREHLARKFETSQGRIMQRIELVESRLEAAINKLQGIIDKGFGTMDIRVGYLENEMAEIVASVKETKSYTIQCEEIANKTFRTLIHHAEKSKNEMATHHQINKITDLLQNIQNEVNRTTVTEGQNDGPNAFVDNSKTLNSLKSDFVNEAQKIGNKVNNMYNDLWTRIISVEEFVKTGVSITNLTRIELQEEIKGFLMENREADDGFLEIAIDSCTKQVQRKIHDLGRKMDTDFHRVITSQNIFMDSCHRLQEDEPQLENKVTVVLEQIFDTIINRTSSVENHVTELLKTLKSHHSSIVDYTSNIITALSEESNADHKHLVRVIYDLTSSLQEFQDLLHENINDTLSKFSLELQIALALRNETIFNSYLSNNDSSNATNLEENGSNNIFENVSALEASYNQGVLKIYSHVAPTEMEPGGKNDSLVATTPPFGYKNKSMEIPILLLNSSLDTSNITAIITEPILIHGPSNTNVSRESLNSGEDTLEGLSDKRLKNLTSKNVTEVEKSMGARFKAERNVNRPNPKTLSESVAINLMLLYMKVLKGSLSKSEFLKEANPSEPYESIEELIKSIKGSKHIPNDFLIDLETWDNLEEHHEDGSIRPKEFRQTYE